MEFKPKPKNPNEKHQVTIEDVNRVLEVGRMLFSVLTEEEIEALTKLVWCKNPIGGKRAEK